MQSPSSIRRPPGTSLSAAVFYCGNRTEVGVVAGIVRSSGPPPPHRPGRRQVATTAFSLCDGVDAAVQGQDCEPSPRRRDFAASCPQRSTAHRRRTGAHTGTHGASLTQGKAARSASRSTELILDLAPDDESEKRSGVREVASLPPSV
ncbi:hypothetical protein CSOJ01_12407 [Colletotrichum sojae]|uniref:Uncharacterized protein n=1 Tax=Colletotrichum sojae TaxID=2175907 RepID=A0A8H6IVN0_9PEZI|nr:hypothetical protein CSOJ01_12407 [Colletotrichum sojae]